MKTPKQGRKKLHQMSTDELKKVKSNLEVKTQFTKKSRALKQDKPTGYQTTYSVNHTLSAYYRHVCLELDARAA